MRTPTYDDSCPELSTLNIKDTMNTLTQSTPHIVNRPSVIGVNKLAIRHSTAVIAPPSSDSPEPKRTPDAAAKLILINTISIFISSFIYILP